MQDSKIPMQPIDQSAGLAVKKHSKKTLKQKIILTIFGVFSILFGFCVAAFFWYNVQLSPIDKNATSLIKISVKNGSSTGQVADLLHDSGMIRNVFAFKVYLKLSGNEDKLQAGTYRIAKSESVSQIVGHLINGKVDQFSITFYPGATLVDNTDKPEIKKTDVTTILKRAGYSEEEISAALRAKYVSPLFNSKPASADLEGYIYGETYNFNVGASVSEIFEKVFDEFYGDITANNLIDGFKSRGLNLYEGITLASIIQKEVNTEGDQKQVAGVFYNRLDQGMVLGSDVTYQYIADKNGLVRDPNLDSPYNTRVNGGLTPGPIAAPGLSALMAVASPNSNEYLYFLSGDDDITYFASTYAEHESNIVNHCKIKCSTN